MAHRIPNAFSWAYDSDWWYSPKHELSYAGYFLIEPGELFRFKHNYLNDDKMIRVNQVLRWDNSKENRVHRRKCLNCGKSFVNRKYLALHKRVGCGRKITDQIFYEQHFAQLEREGMGINPPLEAFGRT